MDCFDLGMLVAMRLGFPGRSAVLRWMGIKKMAGARLSRTLAEECVIHFSLGSRDENMVRLIYYVLQTTRG